MITKSEFIAQYCHASGGIGPNFGDRMVHADGMQIGGLIRYAYPCDCGDDLCQGWKMGRWGKVGEPVPMDEDIEMRLSDKPQPSE